MDREDKEKVNSKQVAAEDGRLKVCMVGSFPPPIGGVATVCYNISAQLSRLGVEVFFFDTNSSADKTIPDGICDYEVMKPASGRRIAVGMLKGLLSPAYPGFLVRLFRECFRYRKNLGVNGILNIFMVAVSLFNKLSRNSVDLVNTHHAYSRSLAALVVGRSLGLPVVVTLYASEFTSSALGSLRPMATYICNAGDSVICISEHTASVARKNGVTANLEVVYLGVNTDIFRSDLDVSELKNKFSINGDKVILYTGWLIERKGAHLLLQAVKELKEVKQDRMQVFLIGPDHGLKQSLESEARSLESDQLRIHVLGPVDDRTLRSFYTLADFLVFPTMTDDEGFGLVAVEAMASGTPVIGSRIGAIPEVIRDKETGLLFAPGDSSDLARKINMLLQDVKLLNRMKGRTREYVEVNFSWEATASKTASIYRETVRKI
ncbi:glycosyltransferase family 4 protein [Chloroflexota bacterium]